jgi:hypothetical protein
MRVSDWYTLGAKKYGDNNWRKGQPVSRCAGSLLRHLTKYFMGQTDEDHLSAVVFNAIKYERDNQTYKKHYDTLKSLAYAKDGLMVLVPKTCQEIIDEGRALNHCVGSYVDRVMQGDTTILFIRQASDPENPYFTMEWRNKRIVQVRGKRNCDAPDDVKAFLDAWLSRQNKHRAKTARKEQHETY